MNALSLSSTLTMSSLEVAELTGKRHHHVVRDIRTMIEALGDEPNLVHLSEVKDSRGYTAEIRLPKRECLILVSGYLVQLRARIIDRWQELEAQAQQDHGPQVAHAPNAPSLPLDLNQVTAAMTQMMAPLMQSQVNAMTQMMGAAMRELTDFVWKLKQDEGHRHYPAPYPPAPPVEPAVSPAVEPAEAPGPRAELGRKGGLARATKGVRGPDGRFVKAT